jgi:methylated-DNA-[protein]-cysteine S-methyltransferase
MFRDEVFEILKKVPRGSVTTYGELARVLGRPGAARAVGNALNKNEHLKTIPCHRVVKSNGELGGFALGVQVKTEFLAEEGIKVKDGRVVDFKIRLYKF